MSECIAQQEEIIHQENIKHISWDDLDKRKYYTIGPTMMLGVRILIYPPMLIKTRIQVQKHKSSYNGTLDAFRKIYKYEGFRGFYKGFGTSTLSMFSGQIYITTFEVVREKAPTSQATKSLIAGVVASIAGQTLTVPIDVISQKQMMYGQNFKKDSKKPKWTSAYSVAQNIFRKHGLKGFYKGYVASILTYTPNSGIWWACYYKFTQFFGKMRPEGTPDLVVQGLSGPSAAIVASWLTNPNDIIRTRLQVEGSKDGIKKTLMKLIKEEGLPALWTKGLTARFLSAIPSGFFLSVSYELIKKLSRKENKHDVDTS